MLTTADLIAAWLGMVGSFGGLWVAVFGFVVALELVHFGVDIVRGD